MAIPRTIITTRAPAEVILIRILVGWVFLSEGIEKFLYPAEQAASRFERIAILEEWEERGEMIIRKTFRLSTGGATGKRGRAEGDAGVVRYQRRQQRPASSRFGHRSTGLGTAIAASRLRASEE